MIDVYKCADSSCDTPPPIDSSSEDQCDQKEWSPDYDDCIAKYEDEASYSAEIAAGTEWNLGATFDGFQDEGHYAVVGYIFHPDEGGIVTDTPESTFEVKDSSTSDPESSPNSDPEPDVREVDGDIPVEVENGEITARPEFTNVGDGDMEDSDIVEMQVRPEGTGLLNFLSWSSPQRTCDSDHPENVHKEFQLDAGDTEEIPLSTSTDNVAKGAWYDVWIVTREDCGGDRADPYGGGVIADSVYVEEDLQEPTIRLGSEDIEVQATEEEVRTEFSLENVGDKDMQDTDIVEMQVRPRGEGMLNTVTSTSPQRTCDTSHPENVHREYQIGGGEETDISLSTSRDNLEKGKTYDVWIITREECDGGPAQPYGTGTIADTVKLSSSSETGGGDNDGDELPTILIAAGVILVIGGVLYRWA